MSARSSFTLNYVSPSVIHQWQREYEPSAKDLEQVLQGITNRFGVPSFSKLIDAWKYMNDYNTSITLERVAQEFNNTGHSNSIMLSKAIKAYVPPATKYYGAGDEPRGYDIFDYDEPAPKPIQKSPAFPPAIYGPAGSDRYGYDPKFQSSATKPVQQSPAPPKKKILFSDVPMSQVSSWNRFCLPKLCFGKINSMVTKKPFTPIQNSFMDHWLYVSVSARGLLLEDYASFLLALDDCSNAIALAQAIFDYIEAGGIEKPKEQHVPDAIESKKIYPPKKFTNANISIQPYEGVHAAQWLQWNHDFQLTKEQMEQILHLFIQRTGRTLQPHLKENCNLTDLIDNIYNYTGIGFLLSVLIETVLHQIDTQTQNSRNLARAMHDYLHHFCPNAPVILFPDSPEPSVCRPCSPPPPKPAATPIATQPSTVVADDIQPPKTTLSDDQPLVLPTLPPTNFKGCAICFENDNDAVLLPCSHGYCFKCASEVTRCPKCRMLKSSVIRIFLD